jgi:predicted DNA-binding transcriptional regulator AlpA
MQCLSCSEVTARFQISRSTLYRWQENPEICFPEPMKIGHRILWREDDLKEFDDRVSRRLEVSSHKDTTAKMTPRGKKKDW